MSFFNWAKILWTIRYLNDLNKKTYFDLESFCNTYDLDYTKISNFLEISNSIINGDSELIKAIEKEKETLDKLNNLNPNVLSNI